MHLILLLILIVASCSENHAYNIQTQSNKWVVRRISCATVASLTTFFMTNFHEPVHATDGTKLFEANCAGCHRGGSNLFEKDKTLFKDALQQNGYTDAAKIAEIINNGKGMMLPMPKLGDTDQMSIANYVLDMADKNWPAQKDTRNCDEYPGC